MSTLLATNQPIKQGGSAVVEAAAITCAPTIAEKGVAPEAHPTEWIPTAPTRPDVLVDHILRQQPIVARILGHSPSPSLQRQIAIKNSEPPLEAAEGSSGLVMGASLMAIQALAVALIVDASGAKIIGNMAMDTGVGLLVDLYCMVGFVSGLCTILPGIGLGGIWDFYQGIVSKIQASKIRSQAECYGALLQKPEILLQKDPALYLTILAGSLGELRADLSATNARLNEIAKRLVQTETVNEAGILKIQEAALLALRAALEPAIADLECQLQGSMRELLQKGIPFQSILPESDVSANESDFTSSQLTDDFAVRVKNKLTNLAVLKRALQAQWLTAVEIWEQSP